MPRLTTESRMSVVHWPGRMQQQPACMRAERSAFHEPGLVPRWVWPISSVSITLPASITNQQPPVLHTNSWAITGLLHVGTSRIRVLALASLITTKACLIIQTRTHVVRRRDDCVARAKQRRSSASGDRVIRTHVPNLATLHCFCFLLKDLVASLIPCSIILSDACMHIVYVHVCWHFVVGTLSAKKYKSV